ncbi:MAG: PIG-L family deacetylase [bacterium]|nr:PIG-L family deacetylase [bacterium]
MKNIARNIIKSFMRLGYYWLSFELTDQFLKQSCIVFSPHQDDETLGCGGTIIKKRQLSVPVKIVFMTDGGGSHQSPNLKSGELVRMREAEAIEAAQVMGVKKEDLYFLRCREKELSRYQGWLKNRIIKIIEDFQPEEIFIPYAKDSHIDHIVTRDIVLNAINELDYTPKICEYPIWYWTYWPWITPKPLAPASSGILIRWKTRLKRVLITLSDFISTRYAPRYKVKVEDILNIKWEALNKYRSQMTRLFDDPAWAVLDRKWLKNFFSKYEVFFAKQ